MTKDVALFRSPSRTESRSGGGDSRSEEVEGSTGYAPNRRKERSEKISIRFTFFPERGLTRSWNGSKYSTGTFPR
ncbi:MAG: hypothetical protein Kow0054_21050 [Deferrisoma sp.]